MIDVKKRVEIIEALVAEESIRSLTYAALECRLTIECLCYERLLISHSYISPADLKGWRPKDVVKQISQEANELIDQQYTLSISTTPITQGQEPQTVEDHEAFEYVEVGTQVGFKISKLHSLWQARSNVSLHVDSSYGQSSTSPYGDSEIIKAKVEGALIELKKFESNSIISSGFGEEYNIQCVACSHVIKKKVNLLKDGQVVSCFNPKCSETYTVHKDDSGLSYSRRTCLVKCKSCRQGIEIPMRLAENLRYGSPVEIQCTSCDTKTSITLRIAQEIHAGNLYFDTLSQSRISPSVTWSGDLGSSALPASDDQT